MTTNTTPAKLTGDQYMDLLLERQTHWRASHPHDPRYPPLLEWFIQAGDEDLVELPAPSPRPQPQPRRYRSAESLRAERDRLIARRDEITTGGHQDPAMCNLGGRRRWDQLDRDIEKVARLTKRVDTLGWRIAAAESREQR
jgi:hypothetical protein